MDNTNIIELNGKRYDANSGAMIEDIHRPSRHQGQPNKPAAAAKSEPVATVQTSEPTKPSKQALDGIFPSSHAHHKAEKTEQHKPVERVEATQPEPVAPKHEVHHIVSHQQEHAKTLMRSVVKKPVPVHKAVTRVQSPAGQAITTIPANLPASHSTVDIARLSRAQHVAKSENISRFGTPAASTTFTKEVRELPVQASPQHVIKEHEQHHSAPLEAAIAKAHSHEHALPQAASRARFRSKTINFVAAGMALLLIAGFFTYQNAPNIDLRIASSRAGFQATLPNSKPAGFAFSGPIHYASGEVSISFHSNSDARNFKVIERPSNWDSQTLRDNFVASTGQMYQTFQSAGRTIYVYGGNATWVNGNVWYRITGNSNLSSDQLVNIATST